MYATKIPSDERSLVLRLIEGEEDAFCELYAAYKNRLIYFAMRFLKSREYAEDIFQDAFVHLLVDHDLPQLPSADIHPF